MTYARDYMRGTDNFNATAAKYGEAAAVAQWQAAIEAERNGTPLETGYWTILGSQVYNEPFNAPLEQAGKVAGNTATALGDAVKTAASKAVGNWGVWLLAAVVLIGVFFYLGGSNVVRRRLA